MSEIITRGIDFDAINAEVDTALNTIVPASPTAGSLNDFLSKAAGANTFDKSTDSLEALYDRISAIEAGLPKKKMAVYTGSLANAGTVTILDLDALGVNIKDLKISLRISAATANAVTPHWYKTSYIAPTTLIEEIVPVMAPNTPAAAAILGYELRDLSDGLVGQFTLASVGNDSALTFEAVATWEEN